MNIINQIRDHGWVAAGAIGGVIAGTAAKFLNRNLPFQKEPKTVAHSVSAALFCSINNLRERDREFMRKNFLAPTPFNWFYPTAHVVPMLGYSIYNAYTKKDLQEEDLGSIASRGWTQITMNVIDPSLHTSMLTLSSLFIVRDIVSKKLLPRGVDISGHAIIQGALLIHALNSLQAIARTGSVNQQKLHAIICSMISVTDAVWMYNTARYHSLADIASGYAIVGLTHLGIEIAKAAINKFRNWLQQQYNSE